MCLLDLQLDQIAGDDHRKGVHRLVRGQGLGSAGLEIEERAVAGALDLARIGVEGALGERAVVVRAAVLDGVQIAVAVEDADLEILVLDQLHGAGRELGYGADVDDLWHCILKSDSRGRICLLSVAADAYATRRDLDPPFVSWGGRSGVAAAWSGNRPGGPLGCRPRPALGLPDGAR